MRIFYCFGCGQTLYFENTRCLFCNSALGFLSDKQFLSAIRQINDDEWLALEPAAEGRIYRKCTNYRYEAVCNWMVPIENPDSYCLACALNVTIPNLEAQRNREYWGKLERAKKRLIYNLIKLNLPIENRQTNPKAGLAFEFLEDVKVSYKETKKVMTGHTSGLITINIAEADEVKRAHMQLKMKEVYRTVLGHFRHEIGHYYWSLLISEQHITAFRELFGDERENYTLALKNYYKDGPKPDWPLNYVSAYASSHSWEDWAETWAHYLHLTDTLETAQAWGLSIRPQGAETPKAQPPSLPYIYRENSWDSFDSMYHQWTLLACAINSMNRSMGQSDFYPFILAQKAIDKLRFVDAIIRTL